MTVEEREKTERPYEDIIQALEEYMRQEVSYEAIKSDDVLDSIRKRLAMKARDFAFAHSIDLQDSDANRLANAAIARYAHNWKGKKQGEDDRGHRLGCSW